VDNDDADRDADATTGFDDEAEQFIPGTLNINTVIRPVAVMATGTPSGSPALFDSIFRWRDVPADRAAMSGMVATALRSQRGIASIGEMLLVNPTATASPGTTDEGDMYYYMLPGGGSQVTAGPVSTEFNQYPLPEAAITDFENRFEAEGRMAQFQFLANLFTTRSDVFTAYVLIRGYPANDFTAGPIESKRFLAIYDRSQLRTGTERVRIMAMYELN